MGGSPIMWHCSTAQSQVAPLLTGVVAVALVVVAAVMPEAGAVSTAAAEVAFVVKAALLGVEGLASTVATLSAAVKGALVVVVAEAASTAAASTDEAPVAAAALRSWKQ